MANLICNITKQLYDINKPLWRSMSGELLDISFTPVFDINKIQNRKPNLWRYRESIPIEYDKNILSVEEGFTPLLNIHFDEKSTWIKQEQLFSSGSYKDRGASVLMSKVKELGIKKVVQDSSGNAGCAVAMYAALGNINCDIFVGENTSQSKLNQMEMYGAHLHKINGTREDVAEAAFQSAQKNYYASHCWNPFFFQGTKTFAFEVCEQLGWSAPDVVVVPAGNGTLLLGCYIGFNELFTAGIISKIPKLIAVQSENCAPLFAAFHPNKNETYSTKKSETIAEGIAIAKPIRLNQMLEVVKKTNGHVITVSEMEILDSLKLCGQMGYYIEPTSAATIAGLREYLKESNNEKIVSLFSGHGLKSK
jgi:threonine synthase